MRASMRGWAPAFGPALCVLLAASVPWSGPALAQSGSIGTAPAATPGAFLRGYVRDGDGSPLAGAQIFAGENSFTTGADGAFRLRNLPRGLLTLLVRRIGFRPSVTQWDLTGDTLSLDLRMLRVPQELPAVKVVAKAQPYDSRLAGFNQRLKSHMGYYITRQDIERRSDRTMSEALRELPGVRVANMPGAMGTGVYLRGSRCSPMVFIDGFPAALGHFDVDQINLNGVEGVEVYPHSSSVPSEFVTGADAQQCGVVAIWLAPMRPNPRPAPREDPVDVRKLIASGAVYLPDSVDQPAALRSGSPRVEYPDSLLRAGVGARLSARFVVDTAGQVEMNTVQVTGTPAPARAFINAVRASLPYIDFVPARVAGKAVRQVVVLPFLFEPAAPSGAKDTLRTGSDTGAAGH